MFRASLGSAPLDVVNAGLRDLISVNELMKHERNTLANKPARCYHPFTP